MKEKLITIEERKWITWFAVLVLGVTSIPYLLGYFRQGTDWGFTGFIFGVEDGNSYIAKMLNGASGDWLFKTPYTAYPQNGFLAFLPYILLGKLTAPPGQHEQLVFLFQLFRWFAGFLVIMATYDFIALFIEDISLRRLGTAVISLGGGIGWLAFLGLGFLWKNGLPLEFYSPESFGFLSIFGLPHLALARALLLWGLCRYLHPVSGKSKILDRVRNISAWFLIGFVQPLTIISGWAVILAHLGLLGILILWQKSKRHPIHEVNWRSYITQAIGIFIFSAPFVIYNFLAFYIDPFLKQWGEQNIILSPPVLEYILAYVLLLPLIVLGVVKTFKNPGNDSLLLIGWLVVFPILVSVPYNLQRRLPEGIWAAMVILALLGLANLASRIRLWGKMVMGLSFVSSLILLSGGCLALWNPSLPLYRPKTEVELFQYLQKNARTDQVVLASYATSNALPAWAPLHILAGHGPESIHLKEILPKVNAFYQGQLTDVEAHFLLEEFHVDYIVITTEAPGIADTIAHLLYQNEGYQLYEVIR